MENRPNKSVLELMSNRQLTENLKERGLKSTGTKNALINRLFEGYLETRYLSTCCFLLRYIHVTKFKLFCDQLVIKSICTDRVHDIVL